MAAQTTRPIQHNEMLEKPSSSYIPYTVILYSSFVSVFCCNTSAVRVYYCALIIFELIIICKLPKGYMNFGRYTHYIVKRMTQTSVYFESEELQDESVCWLCNCLSQFSVFHIFTRLSQFRDVHTACHKSYHFYGNRI